jgi:hypothetical protein
MSRPSRIARDVAVGAGAVVVVTLVRRAVTEWRLDHGLPVRNSRRVRKLQRARERDALRWAAGNLPQLRALLEASEKASVQLSVWDNSRRTSESFLDSATVVQNELDTATASASRKDALRGKITSLHSEAQPHLEVGDVAQGELAKLQDKMGGQLKVLRREAPTEVVTLAKELVASHEAARRPVPGRLDEVAARRRMDEISDLRESLEGVLARLLPAAR